MKHGTNGGYQQHRRRGEDACSECIEAHRIFRGQRRDANSENARERALRRLAQVYPSEFRRLYYAELRRA